MNEIHTLTVNGESYILRDAQTLAAVENLSNEVVINNTDRIEAEEALADRVTLLEQDYRHIFTYEHTPDEAFKQIDITQDKDGNPFSCSEIFIYATIPPATGEQVYVGTELWKWIYFPAAPKAQRQQER